MFFFFISEVGIRDYKVTVFQTCALPISLARLRDDSDLIDKGDDLGFRFAGTAPDLGAFELGLEPEPEPMEDRKSTRLNSSHLVISYAVFCLKKKKKTNNTERQNYAKGAK